MVDYFEFENGYKIDIPSLTKALPTFVEASENMILLKNYKSLT